MQYDKITQKNTNIDTKESRHSEGPSETKPNPDNHHSSTARKITTGLLESNDSLMLRLLLVSRALRAECLEIGISSERYDQSTSIKPSLLTVHIK